MNLSIRACCLVVFFIASGCTIAQYRQSFPLEVSGGEWSRTPNWTFATGVETVTGYGLAFQPSAHNEDRASEFFIPTKGLRQSDPFIVTAYIVSIDDGIAVDWSKMKIISKGREYHVRYVIGPYVMSKDTCTAPLTMSFQYEKLDHLSANTCVLLEFDATNSDIGWEFDSELSGLKKKGEPLPDLKIRWHP